MSRSVLASSIANVAHFVAFDTLVKNRLNNFEVEKLLIYIIDTVDASALPMLAAQFDVEGYKGMRLAVTDDQKREVIKRAIELKRYKGTVWAVEEALKSIGYPDSVLTEHVLDGPTGWATFRIELNAGDQVVSAAAIEELIKMINEFKNTRSHLVDLTYRIDLGEDSLVLTEESDESPSVDDDDTIFSGGDFRHNGMYLRNGSRNYSSDNDVLEIEIITI